MSLGSDNDLNVEPAGNLRAKLLLGTEEQSALTNLDGIRGLACILVIASHTLFAPESCGATGVWMFFTLSGFLLFRSLSPNLLDWQLPFITTFLCRRILRIVPLYLVAVLVYGLLWNSDSKFFVDHWFFRDAKSFFWTVKTELLFYLLLPMIGGVLAFLKDDRLKAVALLTSAILYHLLIELPYRFVITAVVTEIPLYLSPFLLGMAGSAISKHLPEKYARILSFVAMLSIVICCTGFAPSMPLRQLFFGDIGAQNVGWRFIGVTSVLCALFVVGCARSRSNLIFSNPIIRNFGLFGYSAYLWHILVFIILKRLLPSLSDWEYLISVLLMTYPLAALSFMFAERPLINLGRRITSASKNSLTESRLIQT